MDDIEDMKRRSKVWQWMPIKQCRGWGQTCLYSRHAKSVCRPSSREMSSLENVSPGMRPRFFNQKMAQKLQREFCVRNSSLASYV